MSRVVAVREEVFGFVLRHPGVHVREVERNLGLSSRLAAHHLEHLEAEGRVRRFEEAGYTRFLDAGTAAALDEPARRLLFLARRAPVLQILGALLERGEMPHRDLADALGLAKASVSYHLKVLLEEGHATVRAQGRERLYALSDPARVRALLARYPPTPETRAAFDAMWDSLFG